MKKWREYEKYKARLCALGLSPSQHEAVLKILADALEL